MSTTACSHCGHHNPENAKYCQECGAALSIKKKKFSDPLIGRRIGNHKLIRRIGVGGMGVVYLAEHVNLGKEYAIKFLHPQFASDEEVVERFRREARVMASIDHENIIRETDFGWLDGVGFYLIMEYLKGQTLKEVIRSEGALSFSRVQNLFRQFLDAMQEAHSNNIVHRDLKPENLFLIQRKGKELLKILDFGIARIAYDNENKQEFTVDGEVYGSPTYMSPEQAKGEIHKVDNRSDLYSVGIILVEALTGRPPFKGSTPAEVMLSHITTPPPTLAELRPDLTFSSELEAVVQKALAKEREDRFQSAEEFSEALEYAFETAQRQYPVDSQNALPSSQTSELIKGELHNGTPYPNRLSHTDAPLPSPSSSSSGNLPPLENPSQEPSGGWGPSPAPSQEPSGGWGSSPAPSQEPSGGWGPSPAPSQEPSGGWGSSPAPSQEPNSSWKASSEEPLSSNLVPVPSISEKPDVPTSVSQRTPKTILDESFPLPDIAKMQEEAFLRSQKNISKSTSTTQAQPQIPPSNASFDFQPTNDSYTASNTTYEPPFDIFNDEEDATEYSALPSFLPPLSESSASADNSDITDSSEKPSPSSEYTDDDDLELNAQTTFPLKELFQRYRDKLPFIIGAFIVGIIALTLLTWIFLPSKDPYIIEAQDDPSLPPPPVKKIYGKRNSTLPQNLGDSTDTKATYIPPRRRIRPKTPSPSQPSPSAPSNQKKEMIRLHIETIPPQATVFLRGQGRIATTPCTLTFLKGTKVSLEIRKIGYMPLMIKWTAKEHSRTKFRLAPN